MTTTAGNHSIQPLQGDCKCDSKSFMRVLVCSTYKNFIIFIFLSIHTIPGPNICTCWRDDTDQIMVNRTLTTFTDHMSQGTCDACRAGPSLLGALSRMGPPPLPPRLMIIDTNGTLSAKIHKDPPPICAKVDVTGGVGRVWWSSPRNVLIW